MSIVGCDEKTCSSLEETDQLAKMLSFQIEPGDIIILEGELGSGKTTFTRFLSHHLGIPTELISSPTFIYMHSYQGETPIYHYDLYRLQTAEQFFALGLDEYLFKDGISIIEWPQTIKEFLPEQKTIQITLSIISEDSRKFQIRRKGYDTTL